VHVDDAMKEDGRLQRRLGVQRHDHGGLLAVHRSPAHSPGADRRV
jgi:hypothetical protein